mgnify:CR=1 FL=1
MGGSQTNTGAAGSSGLALESRATRFAIVAFVLTGVVTIFVFHGTHAPLAGDGSIGALAAWAAGGFAAAAFATSFTIEVRRGHAAWRARLPLVKRLIDVFGMSMAMGILAYLIVTAVAQLFQQGFLGMTVDAYGGGVLSGAAAAALVYAASLAGARVTSEGLAMLATLVLFMGTMASMLSAPDESWWQLHFSQLGNSESMSGYRFNLALMVTGLVLTVLANYIGREFELGLKSRGVPEPGGLVRLLSWLFAGIGVLLAIAGLVPDAVNIVIHVGSASGMVVLFVVFATVALRSLPGVPKDFIAFTVGVVIGIAVSIALWIPIGYYNLTGMEFIAAGLLFAWLMVFVRMVTVYGSGGAVASNPLSEL